LLGCRDEQVADVVVEVRGLVAARRDRVHVDVEGQGIVAGRERREQGETRLLARLAQRDAKGIALAVCVTAKLEPAAGCVSSTRR
jgi:hypothetical protein